MIPVRDAVELASRQGADREETKEQIKRSRQKEQTTRRNRQQEPDKQEQSKKE
jgi:hypothetical protein